MYDGFAGKAFDLSARSWTRVILLTIVGTLCCIVFAFTFDSYSFEENLWRLGSSPWNDVIIPLLIAPPFFFYLLSKFRQLAIAHDQLLVVASTDGLTSCLTRVAFTTLVDAYLERVDRQERRREPAQLGFRHFLPKNSMTSSAEAFCSHNGLNSDRDVREVPFLW
jgi:diguanylate cyclase